jgi:hypothetical protein
MASPPSHCRYRAEPTRISEKILQKFAQAQLGIAHQPQNKREIIKDDQ